MTTVTRLIHLRRGRCPRIGELSWFNRCCLVEPPGPSLQTLSSNGTVSVVGGWHGNQCLLRFVRLSPGFFLFFFARLPVA